EAGRLHTQASVEALADPGQDGQGYEVTEAGRDGRGYVVRVDASLFGRLQSFLPQMAEANEKLKQQMEEAPEGRFDIENVDEAERIIEMVSLQNSCRGRRLKTASNPFPLSAQLTCTISSTIPADTVPNPASRNGTKICRAIASGDSLGMLDASGPGASASSPSPSSLASSPESLHSASMGAVSGQPPSPGSDKVTEEREARSRSRLPSASCR
uniref:Uncharacterized protein n=1 Tax=Fundulus heteroclitus TaxID=8078 RepID=A0A3Q2TDM5_FUNHE